MKGTPVHRFEFVSPKNGHVGDALEFIQFRLAFVEWALKVAGNATDDADEQIALTQLAEIISDAREAAELIKDDRERLLDKGEGRVSS